MKRRQPKIVWGCFAAALLILTAGQVKASVTLLVEEPYGRFGGMNPTGHAAIYLDHVCAETPTRLRMCNTGELGVVISRYYKVGHYDWIAIPLIPYLYAVDDISEIPLLATRELQDTLQETYRRRYLRELVPDEPDGRIPRGEWTQLVGESYQRKMYGYEVETTQMQDKRLIAMLNGGKNKSHFNLLFRNCADFAKGILNFYFPDSARRNVIADGGFTTPKQISRSLVKYVKAHDDLKLKTFIIPQVPGNIPRSTRVNGVAESLVKSKKYLIPLLIFRPEVTAGIAAVYLGTGRYSPPKDAEVFSLSERMATASSFPEREPDESVVSGGQ